MKTIKPLRLGVLPRPYLWQGQHQLAVAVYAWVSMGHKPMLHPDHDLWPTLSRDAGPEAVFDLVMPKIRQEYLLSGYAYPCHHDDASRCAVRMQVGHLEKSLLVFGDRYWLDGKITAAQPFERMPLRWEYAWGGAGQDNPVGKGLQDQDVNGVSLKPLPNLELAQSRYQSPSRPGVPACCGPRDPAWPSRMATMKGTYDQRWMERDFPGMASDVDWRYFNAAPEDQWLEPEHGKLEGATYRLWNVHPDREILDGYIPDWHVRCHISRDAEAAGMESYDMRLSTAWFFPEQERVALIWHTQLPIQEDDAKDIYHIMPSLDEGQSRDSQHYHSVMKKRLDHNLAVVESLRDIDLLPSGVIAPWDALEIPDIMQRPLPQRVQAAKRKEREAHAAMLRDEGKDPEEFLPPEEEMPEVVALEDLAEVFEKSRQQAEQFKKEMEALSAEMWQESGVAPPSQDLRDVPCSDPDKEARALNREGGTADSASEQLDIQKTLRETYFYTAHNFGPPEPISDQRKQRLRRRLSLLREQGLSAKGLNLNAADLSGMDLSGLDFSGALLHDADLSGADISGCVFDKAVLVRVKAYKTRCQAACFTGANLGLSEWREASMSQADFTKAQVEAAQFFNCDMQEAVFSSSNVTKTIFQAVDLRRSAWVFGFVDEVSFLEHSLLQGASFKQVVLYHSKFTDSQMQDSLWERCSWVDCRFDTQASLSGALLEACSAVSGTAFDAVDFSGVEFKHCGLRGVSWKQAVLRGAHFNETDMSEGNFQDADLEQIVSGASRFIRADFRGASLRGANLMDAIMDKALLIDADLTGANLFRADVGQAWMDASTCLDNTYTHQAKWLPLRKEA